MAIIHRGIARRKFLQRAALFSAAAGTPFVNDMIRMASASAASAVDYKALVCIFLNGGNDQSNTIVPLDASAFAAYSAARPNVALAANAFLPVGPVGYGAGSFGLHPSLTGLAPLFSAGSAAVVANVGTLVYPTSKGAWNNGSPTISVPSQLFSHADQAGAWQTGLPDQYSVTGWLGRVGDLTQAAFNPGAGISISMSVAGNAILMTGEAVIQYQISTQGAIPNGPATGPYGLYGYAAGEQAAARLLTQARTQMLENEYVAVNSRALSSQVLLSSALSSVPLPTSFPNTQTGAQLAMVARLISARAALGHRRQIFFVQQGGYDTHNTLVASQAANLQELGDAMAAFHAATAAAGLGDHVTAFTASDFGRALVPNSDGSDHGWGGHHFVVGGAVQGNRIYGTFPQVMPGGIEDAGQGRLIPTTSVDQYAACLAGWFGVPAHEMATVVPNIGRFSSSLGLFG